MRKITAWCLCLCCLLPFLFLPVCAEPASYSYPAPEVLAVDLYMRPDHYLKMIHSEEKHKYPAVVSIDGSAPQDIGVQVRGTMSLADGLSSASKRVPLELCFDYADANGTFRGNASLKLINCYTPARLITQYVAMQTFLFLNIPTPRTTPVFIRINDVDFGLYLAIEDLNADFVRNNLGSGSLYRPILQKDSNYEEGSPLYEPFVVYDRDMEHSSTLRVKVDHGHDTLRRCNQARLAGQAYEDYLNVDEILRFIACEMFLNNLDGFALNRKNYYLYDDRGRLMLLPWDKDDVFNVFAGSDEFFRFDEALENLYPALAANETYRTQYHQYLHTLNDAFLDPDVFLPWLESTIRYLTPFFQRDATIAQPTADVYADLTSGRQLYNGCTGNLMLTFRTYHDQAKAILSGSQKSFRVPQDALAPEPEDPLQGTDCSVIFRVCMHYWNLRRLWRMQTEGAALIGIGLFFAAVFLAAVCAVYIPKRKRRRKEGAP